MFFNSNLEIKFTYLTAFLRASYKFLLLRVMATEFNDNGQFNHWLHTLGFYSKFSDEKCYATDMLPIICLAFQPILRTQKCSFEQHKVLIKSFVSARKFVSNRLNLIALLLFRFNQLSGRAGNSSMAGGHF